MNANELVRWCRALAAGNRMALDVSPPLEGYEEERARLAADAERFEAIADLLSPESAVGPEKTRAGEQS